MAPRVGVVLFPGSNCEQDAIEAIRELRGDADVLWHGDESVAGFDAVIVPGGFAYLDTDPGACAVTSALGGQWTSKTGNSVPSACATSDFSKWIGKTVLLPLFDQSGLTGTNATPTSEARASKGHNEGPKSSRKTGWSPYEA